MKLFGKKIEEPAKKSFLEENRDACCGNCKCFDAASGFCKGHKIATNEIALCYEWERNVKPA